MSVLDQALPAFKYHPDPLATGSIVPSDASCACCGQVRGHIYVASFYAKTSYRRRICPWCIADGSAAQTLRGSFVDDYPLMQAGLPAAVVDEVCTRTPGFISWQQERWLTCCGDACEFHGDARKEELEALDKTCLPKALRDFEHILPHWSKVVGAYRPGSDPAIYKFVCRRCRETRFGVDSS